ncbi:MULTISPECIES: hypothetical protein [Marinobacter]|uniref:hypothetical protein n=1 Tax=Marinobacter TaxID=2742 RepID=UPI001C99C778|nr:hypothetical protein [Marinobacter nauticus]MBY5961311.1 hypothetical protein [Marinobacter nauticus]
MVKTIIASMLVFSALPLYASDSAPLNEAIMGLEFDRQTKSSARSAMDQQAQRAPAGGELTETIVVKTYKRLGDSFDQPMPAQIGESTRND